MTYTEIQYQSQLAYFRALLKGSWNIDKPSIEEIIDNSPFEYENKMFLKMRDELFDSFKLDIDVLYKDYQQHDISFISTTGDKKRMYNKIENLATKENATDYVNAEEGNYYIFCLDLLELNVDDDGAEEYVNALEDKFDILNGIERSGHWNG